MSPLSSATDPPATDPPASDPPVAADAPPAAAFVTGFFAFVAAGLAAFAAALALLDRMEMLPPPPLTATSCIDEKFRFLSGVDLANVDLLAVGSSVTWRNLDMDGFRRAGLARRPLNAAPCYLHIGETAFYADFLLRRMPAVRTVVTMVAPRDFEQCSGGLDAFFPERLAAAYLFHGMPALPIYLSNLKPHRFLPDMFRIARLRQDANESMSLVMDEHGSGPLLTRQDWLPAPAVAEACFASLAALERIVEEAGARLVVVTMPMQEAWHRRHDPDGRILEAFERRLREALRGPSTRFVPGDSVDRKTLQHVDAVHFDWPSAVRFTDGLVAGLRRAATR